MNFSILTKLINRLSLKIFVYEVNNIKNLPEEGGYLITSNHNSHIDPLLIASIICKYRNRQVFYIGKKDALKNPIFLLFYKLYSVIPIDLNKKDTKVLKIASSVLKKGEIVGIFPEGSRSPDGKLQKGKTGAVRLALWNKVPIVPVGIIGTFDLWPLTKKIPKIKRCVKIDIGKPIYLTNYYNKKINRYILRKITNQVMKNIGELLVINM